MFRIEPYQPADLPSVVAFVAAIQEIERASVPELKPGSEIGSDYAGLILGKAAERDGIVLMARSRDEAIGFVCAWIETDEDPCLREEARRHAYVSDIFVVESWWRRGVGRALLAAIESAMRERGCRRARLCAKATNLAALKSYAATGYAPYEVILSKAID